MKKIESKTVIFIHGAFVHYSGWDQWRAYFESRGYKTLAPPWPHKEAPAKELRDRQPDPEIAALRLAEVIDSYADIIRGLPEKPILIGHSTGGLIVQVLVNRGLAAAGVAIHPVPPLGVIPYEFSFLKAGLKSLGLLTSTKKTYLMSLKDWQYAFTNGMSLEEQKNSYEKSVVPESKLLARDALSSAAKVDFSKPHPPLLFLAGSDDHIMPATLTRRIYRKYLKNKDSVTDFKEFAGRNHFVVNLPNWRETADYVLAWLGAELPLSDGSAAAKIPSAGLKGAAGPGAEASL